MIAAKAEELAGPPNPGSVPRSLIHPDDSSVAGSVHVVQQAKKDLTKPEQAAPKKQHRHSPQVNIDDDDGSDVGGDELLPEARPAYTRSEADAKAKFRENAVHVYGLDFLQTEHMNEIFSQFEHKYIEWINDSSANIIFKNAESARQALESLSYAKAGDAPWRRTPDILVNDDAPPVFLQMRLATLHDHKSSKKSVPKLLPLAPTWKGSGRVGRRRQGAIGGTGGAATMEGVTRKGPVSQEEVARRQKRAERFGAELGSSTDATPATRKVFVGAKAEDGNNDTVANQGDAFEVTDAGERDSASTSVGTSKAVERKRKAAALEAVEATQEELEKRRKRADRFKDTAKANSAQVVDVGVGGSPAATTDTARQATSAPDLPAGGP